MKLSITVLLVPQVPIKGQLKKKVAAMSFSRNHDPVTIYNQQYGERCNRDSFTELHQFNKTNYAFTIDEDDLGCDNMLKK